MKQPSTMLPFVPDLDCTSFSEESACELGFSSEEFSSVKNEQESPKPSSSCPGSRKEHKGTVNDDDLCTTTFHLKDCGKTKLVTFSTVTIFRHSVILGDHIVDDGGPPLALGNICVDYDDLEVDLYELCRPPRHSSVSKLKLNFMDRTLWLSKEGYDLTDIMLQMKKQPTQEEEEKSDHEPSTSSTDDDHFEEGGAEDSSNSRVWSSTPGWTTQEPVRHPRGSIVLNSNVGLKNKKGRSSHSSLLEFRRSCSETIPFGTKAKDAKGIKSPQRRKANNRIRVDWGRWLKSPRKKVANFE